MSNRIKIRKLLFTTHLAIVLLACQAKPDLMKTLPENAVVRISIGSYPPEKEAEVAKKLTGIFKQRIMPAVKALDGNIGYYVAMDKHKKSITNVSIWESRESAMQMAQMKEMAEMAKEFMAIGVEFEEITNHEMLWYLPE